MPKRSAFTLVELLVSVSIIAILVSLLAPSLRSGLDATRTVVCQSNLRKIAEAALVYSEKNSDYIIPLGYRGGGDWWCAMLVNDGYLAAPRVTNEDVIQTTESIFYCPEGVRTVIPYGAWTWYRETAPFESINRCAYPARHQSRDDGDPEWFVHSWYAANGNTEPSRRGWPVTGINGASTGWHPELRYKTLHDEHPDRTIMFYDGRLLHNSQDNVNSEGVRIVRMTSTRHKSGEQINVGFHDGGAGSMNVYEVPGLWERDPEDSRPRWRMER